ncbi:MAG: GNAT family N-acetyltransferase [Bacteroidota bacterium]
MILETGRLILREFEPSDAKPMFELNSNPEVIKYTGDPPFDSVEAVRGFLKNYSDYRKNGYGRWAVLLKPENEFIGWCGLKLNEEDFTDIGFRFFRKHWNKGYATEAAMATLAFGFNELGLDEIIGRVAAENTASVRVLEKINMRFWKHGSCKDLNNVVYYRKLIP